MLRPGLYLVFFLAITGCSYSKPRVPIEAQNLESRAAEFRHRTLRRNVEIVVQDLITKLDVKWKDHNAAIYDFQLYKLRQDRDAKIKDAKSEVILSVLKEYETAFDKLNAQLKKANDTNTEKLQKYKDEVVSKILDQFDRSEKADIILMRYMMGLQPGPFDSFLIGEPEVLNTDTLNSVLPKKE